MALSPAYEAALIATRDPLFIETAEGRATDKPCAGDICTPADFADWEATTKDWTAIAYAVSGEDSRNLFPIAYAALQKQAEGNTNWPGLIESAIEISREASKAAHAVANGLNYQPPAKWLEGVQQVPQAAADEAIAQAQEELQETLQKLQGEPLPQAVPQPNPQQTPPPKKAKKDSDDFVMGFALAIGALAAYQLIFKKRRR